MRSPWRAAGSRAYAGSSARSSVGTSRSVAPTGRARAGSRSEFGSVSRLRFMVDARPALDPGRTGVGHYADRLIRHLPTADPSARYVAWYLHAKGLLEPRRPRRFFPGTGVEE